MNFKKLPTKVQLFEVGPRDGLQNELTSLTLGKKTAYIEALIASGLQNIEVGAFVREDKIPQMANTDELFKILFQKGYLNKKNLTLWALVPNEKGLDRALNAQCKAIAVFTGATDTFTQKNIGMRIKESLNIFRKIVKKAKKEKLKIRGYVSVCWGCPYEGRVLASRVYHLTKELLNMGVEQISLGDTIGVATPKQVFKLLNPLKKYIKQDQIAVHFHDTRGTALANCVSALQLGAVTLDAASGGLGGCNYAPGASGNVATEDLVYMLSGMKIKTHVDLEKLCLASRIPLEALDRPPSSKYLQAWLAKR